MLHRHVHLLLRRLAGQFRAQRDRVGAGHVHLDARHRVLGEPGDPVDVGAARGDAAGDGGDGTGGQRAADQGDVQPPPPPRRVGRAGGDLRVQPEIGGQAADLPVNGGQVRRYGGRAQHPEHEPSADDHLLDVQHAEVVPGQRAEQARRDARPVPAGEGDQQRGTGGIHRVSNATWLASTTGAADAHRRTRATGTGRRWPPCSSGSAVPGRRTLPASAGATSAARAARSAGRQRPVPRRRASRCDRSTPRTPPPCRPWPAVPGPRFPARGPPWCRP